MADSIAFEITTNQWDDVMTKKIIATEKPARRIEASEKSQRRIEPENFAAALQAEPVGEVHAANLDPLTLAALGNELIKRLRSSGGRPALVDATEICRVPLRVEDVETLERMIVQLGESNGVKPSVGQLVSVIVRAHLEASKSSNWSNQQGTALPVSALPLTGAASEIQAVMLSDWRTSFPNVQDIGTVADCAHSVAEELMPLMLREAA